MKDACMRSRYYKFNKILKYKGEEIYQCKNVILNMNLI